MRPPIGSECHVVSYCQTEMHKLCNECTLRDIDQLHFIRQHAVRITVVARRSSPLKVTHTCFTSISSMHFLYLCFVTDDASVLYTFCFPQHHVSTPKRCTSSDLSLATFHFSVYSCNGKLGLLIGL